MFSRKVISYLVMLVVIVLLGTIVITNLSTHSAVNMTGRQIVRLETPVIEPSLQVELSAETVVPTPTWPPDLPTGIAPTDVAQQAAFTPWPTFPPPPRLDVTPMFTVEESPLEARPDLLPISEVINRAEGVPDSDIYAAIIRRSDGAYAKILLPLALLNYGNFQDNLNRELNLDPQEKLIDAFPLATPMPRTTPPRTPSGITEITQ